jgi:dienelactone hydrolase
MTRLSRSWTILLAAAMFAACQGDVMQPPAGNSLTPPGGANPGTTPPPGPGGGGNVPGAGGAPGGGGSPGAGGSGPMVTPPGAPKKALVFRMTPMDAVMKAAFELLVEVTDGAGKVDAADNTTAVTVKLATGGGQLTGTLTRMATAGVARFEDLEYDQWENITVEASATGFASAISPAVPVRPMLRLKQPPALQVRRMTPLGPLSIELADGAGGVVAPRPGQKVTLEVAASGAMIPGGPERVLEAGAGATWGSVTFMAPGNVTLTFRSEDLQPLSQAVLVFDLSRTEALWLPAARVGVPYTAALPAGARTYQITAGTLPAGLTLDPATGALSGTPSQPVHARMQLAGESGGTLTIWRTDLSIFPETEMPPQPLDQLNADGPFAVGTLDEMVNVASRNRMVKARVYYPQTAGRVAEGKFPVVVFHHGAANTSPNPASPFSTIYLRYDPLLKRWASHGFVVATIDGLDTIVNGGRGTALSIMNLTAMSENQRATITHLKTRNAQTGESGGWALAGHLDDERVAVAGHSRGGGASLITTAANPEVMAAILLKPIDPLMAPGGDMQWSRKLPARPMLINIASDDGDVIYPICDFLFERRASLQSAHTIVGTVHNYSLGCSEPICGPEGRARPRITREQDWAITNAYATAFLKYVVGGDLRYASLVFGEAGLSTGLSPLGVLVRGDRGAAALVVDDFQDADAARNKLGQPTRATGFSQAVDEPSMTSVVARLSPNSRLRALYNRAANLAFSKAHKLVWTAPGASYRTELGGLDVRGRGAFVLRARSDMARIAPADLTITFTDSAGGTATLPGTGLVGSNGLNARFSDLIVPVAAIARAGADPGRLAAVEIKLAAATGTLLLDDLRFE